MPRCKYHQTCELEAQPKGLKCILHSEDPEKDVDEFNTAFEKHRATTSDKSFHGFVFPNSLRFMHARGAALALDFGEAVFLKQATFVINEDDKDLNWNFHNSIFHDRVDFEIDDEKRQLKWTFDEINFSASKFRSRVSFTGEGYISFRNASFYKCVFEAMADFSGVKFDKGSFCEASFKAANFSGSVFMVAADFELAAFEEANFTGVLFHNEVNFGGVRFGKALFTPREDRDPSGASFGYSGKHRRLFFAKQQ